MAMNDGAEVEEKAAPQQPQEQPQVGPFVGGDVVIKVDGRTGAMSVQAPQNLLIALGILESAKALLIQKQQEAIERAQRSALARPSLADAQKILRPS